MKSENQKKLSYYTKLTKALKSLALALEVCALPIFLVSLVSGATLIEAVLFGGASIVLGAATYGAYKISEVYANGYKAEVTEDNKVEPTLEKLEVVNQPVVQNTAVTTYTNVDKKVSSNEIEL